MEQTPMDGDPMDSDQAIGVPFIEEVESLGF